MNRSLQIRGGICLVVILLSVYLLLPTFKAVSYSAEQREAAKTDPTLKSEIAELKKMLFGKSSERMPPVPVLSR